MIDIFVFVCLFAVIVVLIVAIWFLSRIIKRQEKTINDLLDRIMAPNFNDYAIAREQKQRIELSGKKPTKEQEENNDDTMSDGLSVI